MAEDPSFYFNPFSSSWFGWTWRKVILAFPYLSNRAYLFVRNQKRQLDIPFQAFYPASLLPFLPMNVRCWTMIKALRKSRFTVFFSPFPPWRYISMDLAHRTGTECWKSKLCKLKERALSSFYKREVKAFCYSG